MNVNLTLLVQIFNFLIAYWFLSKLIFKPALVILRTQLAERLSLEQSIEKEREALKNKQYFRDQIALKIHNYFKKNGPEVEEVLISEVPSEVSVKQFSGIQEDVRQKIVDEIASDIKLKVIND